MHQKRLWSGPLAALYRARVVDGAPPVGNTPIFYVPGVSERCFALQRMAAGTWHHSWSCNIGRDMVACERQRVDALRFLISKHGGLGLDVAKDQATLDALAGALRHSCRNRFRLQVGVWIQNFSIAWWLGCNRLTTPLVERYRAFKQRRSLPQEGFLRAMQSRLRFDRGSKVYSTQQSF